MRRAPARGLSNLLPAGLLSACAGTSPPGGGGPPVVGTQGTRAAFDLSADLTGEGPPWAFFDLPSPSDLRRTADGRSEWAAFPNPGYSPLVEGIRALASELHGASVLPVAWFRFDGPLDPSTWSRQTIPAATSSAALLLDVDAASPERGRLFPLWLQTLARLPADPFVPENLLALAPRPGFVLAPRRTYAFVVRRGLRDAAGNLLGVPAALDQLRRGGQPPGSRGAAALALYAPLWATLGQLGVDGAEVAAATVFTTGDAVAEQAALSDGLLAKHALQFEGLQLDAAASQANDRVCKLVATAQQPQFQTGLPPFDTGGLFAPGPDGFPALQRTERTPVVLVLPRTPMPSAGYPLMLYFHGSGGQSADLLDRGPSLALDHPAPGRGPAWVHAENGVASAGASLPVDPERVPGAVETAYLNFKNPMALRDTFRQGVIEQRLLLRALLALRIPPALLASCGGILPTLPPGEAAFRFDPDHVFAQGQSMGGMYTNLVAAVEPRVGLAIPTGAGGFWSWFILETKLFAGIPELLGALLPAAAPLTHLHPVLALLQMAWEPNDPFVAMPRLAHRPLPGHPVRPIYEPVGRGDEYFPTQLYDAIALAYGHRQAGAEAWPGMQPALSLARLDGLLTYPVAGDLVSETGERYTAAVVQYEGDGIEDPHQIYRQLPAVRRQAACFVKSWLRGRAEIPDGAGEGECP